MNLITKKNNVVKLNKIIEWLLYMLGYIIVFILVTALFSSVYIDSKHFFLYSTIIVIIIYILNKTVKPILFRLTIPITGITLPFVSYGGSNLLAYLFLIGICLSIYNEEKMIL